MKQGHSRGSDYLSNTTSHRTGLSWLLLALAALLGAGGFMWQHTQKQALLEQIDQQLLIVAGVAATTFQTPDLINDPDNLCRSLLPAPQIIAERFTFSVATQNRGLLCSTNADTEDLHDGQWLSSSFDSNYQFFVADANGDYARTLAYPLPSPPDDPYLLTVSISLASLQQQLSQVRWTILAASLLILTMVAYADRRLRHSSRQELDALSQWMDAITPDQYQQSLMEPVDSNLAKQQSLTTSCRQMTERMLQGLQQSRQFAADVTHELRTPLTILRGETELALRKPRPPEELQRTLTSNLEEINRMSHLIEDLHLLSKCDMGEINLRLEPVCLETLLKELHHQGKILASEKDISVQLHHSEQRTIIQADELRLRQVLLNLISNAIRYTPQQGTVKLDLEIDGHHALISVSDNGIGMDHEHLERIFDRFYRIDHKSTQGESGTGLGLAIVKWIVQAHHGSIEVSSTPNQGSCFVVKLPLVEK